MDDFHKKSVPELINYLTTLVVDGNFDSFTRSNTNLKLIGIGGDQLRDAVCAYVINTYEDNRKEGEI
jgi:hypothetical protein